MNRKFGIRYLHPSSVWKIAIAVALSGLFQIAAAVGESRTVIAQNADAVQGGFARDAPEVMTLPSQRNAELLAGKKAYQNRDYEIALRRLMPLAEQGNMDAQYYIGLMYANGYGLPRDPAKAEKWFKKFSARLGTGAKFNLGVMYFQGKSVPQDYRQAIAWFKRAAEAGDVMAQYSLGFIYDNGYGVPQDRLEAIWWYGKAADMGYLKAQKALGTIYKEGQGVAKDYVKAYFWFNVAAHQGDKSAASKRDALAKEMTTSQIAEAIRLTHEWQLTSEHAGQVN